MIGRHVGRQSDGHRTHARDGRAKAKRQMPHSGTHRDDLTVPFDPALAAEYDPLNRNKLRVGGGRRPVLTLPGFLRRKGSVTCLFLRLKPHLIS